MAASDRKKEFAAALHRFQNDSLFENSIHLFNILRYDTSQRLRLSTGTFDEFKDCYLSSIENFDEHKACTSDWRRVEMLFVLTDQVIQKQIEQFKSEKIADKDIRSYLFFALELKRQNYSRTQLSQIAREFNKAFPEKSVMLLFKHEEFLTLAIVDRRVNKLNKDRDVLKKVTLIKDISITSPHRAHLEILFDLDFFELYRDTSFKNFVDLHTAWQKKLDTSELNKKFYRELANWYFWACQHVVFPADAEPNAEKRNAVHLIRLITRLIFVWFLKEKGLIPPEFFNKSKLDNFLLYDDKKGSTYYKAVLQNLFFATLNQEMNTPEAPEKRKFKRTGLQQDITNLYSYRSFFKNPREALQLFASIPFLNGGLFECLDRWDKNILIDGFWDDDQNPLTVPDFLFFQDEGEVADLSTVYGNKSRKKYGVRGIIHILNSYKFTVTENTPIEEEIALDPELLGRVFENLLAAYNPETQTTARKQTGSFYTPREIVNYMVDESLIAYFETKLLEHCEKASVKSSEGERQRINEKLRQLFSYSAAPHEFATEEVDVLIQAIDDAKILDPACGSGAFPMGILHKMVHILGKLDPKNEYWKRQQLARAKHSNADAETIESIEAAFKCDELDYSRKLYLIKNCIYGVDIQPIAVQIAKLRFFISLIVEQKVAPEKENLGIRPLPNLETKFVAANTLIGLDKPAQIILRNPEIEAKEKELLQTRERHFAARTSKDKARFREMDSRLRTEIAKLLHQDGFSREQVTKLAQWDPYDQNASADFFDSEWMFGLHDGFDIVIGNPPYGLINKRQNKAEGIVIRPEELEYYRSAPGYAPAASGMLNIFRLFILKSINLLQESGIFSEIFPLSFFADVSAVGLRKQILNNNTILSIEAFPERDNEQKRVFEATKMSVCILNLRKSKNPKASFFVRIHRDRFVDIANEKVVFNATLLTSLDKCNCTIPLMSQAEVDLIAKIYKRSTQFASIGHCYTGEVDLTICKHLLTDRPTDAVLIKGAIVGRYFIRKEMSQGEIKFLNSSKYLAENTGKKSSHFKSERIVMQGITGVNERVRLKMTIIPKGIFCANSVNYIVFEKSEIETKFVLGLLNSKLLNFIFGKFSTNSNVNGYEVDNLPYPQAVDTQIQRQIMNVVDQIFSAKCADPNATVSTLESKIDQLVYRLYDLTDEEKAIVEKSCHTKDTVKDRDQMEKVMEAKFTQPRQPMQKAGIKKRTKAA